MPPLQSASTKRRPFSSYPLLRLAGVDLHGVHACIVAMCREKPPAYAKAVLHNKAGVPLLTSRRMQFPSLVMTMPPIGSRSIFSIDLRTKYTMNIHSTYVSKNSSSSAGQHGRTWTDARRSGRQGRHFSCRQRVPPQQSWPGRATAEARGSKMRCYDGCYLGLAGNASNAYEQSWTLAVAASTSTHGRRTRITGLQHCCEL